MDANRDADADGGAQGPRGDDKWQHNFDDSVDSKRRRFIGLGVVDMGEETTMNLADGMRRPRDDDDGQQQGLSGGGATGFNDNGAPVVNR